MEAEIPLSKLQDDVHEALKSWQGPATEASPLDYLHLYRLARWAGASNARQATNEVLLEALQALALDYPQEAELLRKRFLDGMVMYAVANQLNIGEATAYRKLKVATRQLALILQTREAQARAERLARLEKRLEPPTYTGLFGVEDHLSRLWDALTSPGPPWLVSIEGLGGLGKTALADALSRRMIRRGTFDDFAWVSARQQKFLLGLGLEPVTAPALDEGAFIDALLEQFGPGPALAQPLEQKRAVLIDLLKKAPHLVAIDNLETSLDYQTLLPFLRELANPGKFLLTSRHSLQAQPDVFCLNLAELSEADTLRFIRYEANLRGGAMLASASDGQLRRIYEVVGGNPLALKLVIGQVSVLPLSQVLDSLKQAQGKTIDELYVYIYWQAWHLLDAAARQALLAMPLFQSGAFDQLLAPSQLEADGLARALQQLTRLSLVQVGGNLEERRYSIHRLTETFLLEEAIQWQAQA